MQLRIVTWNCATALHDKYERLLALEPDIAIVPECAEPDVLRRKAPWFEFRDCEWGGTNPEKGLGVFTFGDLRLRLHQSWERRFHIFLPLEVRSPVIAINLVAVWAFNHRAPKEIAATPETTRAAIEHYELFLNAQPSVVAGDFNANVRWDRDGKYEPFVPVDARLNELGLSSAYHTRGGHIMGAEPDGTLFWQWKETQSYYIDYVYLPTSWLPYTRSVAVGCAADWVTPRISDHVPVVVECELPAQPVLRSPAGRSQDELPLPARAD